MEKGKNKKKLNTGIKGLDDLFYGGIHLEQQSDDSDGILIMARGEHGVNKIHLAMQMLEGLYVSELKESNSLRKENKYIKEFNPLSEKSNLHFSFPIRMFFLEEAIKILKDKFKEYAEKQIKGKESSKEKEKRERLRTLFDYCNNDAHYARLCAMKYIDIVFPYKKIKTIGIFNQYGVFNKSNIFVDRTKIVDELSKEDNVKKAIDVFVRYSPKNHFSKNYSNPVLLFVSLNKDGKLINDLYFDFYIQRLIKKIKTENDQNAVVLLHDMLWYRDESCVGRIEDLERIKRDLINAYGFYHINKFCIKQNNRYKDKNHGIEIFKEHIKSGYIYYNERTHGFHIRHQSGAEDTGEMLLCKAYIPIESKVAIIGRDELNGGNRTVDGLTLFLNMLRLLDHYLPENRNGHSEKKVNYIMIDGLSCLTQDEMYQCPFNALSDKLRKACVVGVVTADNKASTSYTDIVIDMAIKEGTNPDQLYNILRISKCLYQRNAYGWHSYKMRVAGIEVIPSLRFQTTSRFLMDDAVPDTLLPINKDPYPYWLNESNCIYEDKNIKKAFDDYYDANNNFNGQIDYHNSNGALKGVLHYNKDSAFEIVIKQIKEDIGAKQTNNQCFLFIDLNYNRTEFKKHYLEFIHKQIVDGQIVKPNNIHLFSFQPGYLHDDELLWTVDQQVQAISKLIKNKNNNNRERTDFPDTQYDNIHVIIGDMNCMNFEYPCLNKEGWLLSAIASYTKKHHMVNYVYASVPQGNIKTLDKENEVCRQMLSIVKLENIVGIPMNK